MKQVIVYRKAICIICIFTTSILCASTLYAHGSLSKRIQKKTVEINKHPNDAALYFERGYLYQQHKEFNKAITDYLKSEELGYSNILLHYRKAQAYYNNFNFPEALEASNVYLQKDSVDVKIKKLHAQILTQLGTYRKALYYYDYFIENAIDIRPDDVIEYSKIYLAIDSTNYAKAIEVLEFGLYKLGDNTFSLQLQKLEYLEDSHQIDKAINQYNYFILSTNRKEFWYFKKARYLFENTKYEDSKIAIQQAKTSILLLRKKFQNTSAIKTLKNNINNLESKLTNEN